MKSPTASSSNDEHQPFNPIKSLLSQLQQQQEQEQHHHLHQTRKNEDSNHYSPYQDQPSPSPPPLQHQSPQVPRSIWNNDQNDDQPKVDQWNSRNEEQPNSFYNHVQQQRELGSQMQSDLTDDTLEEESNGFIKPKSSEKKDKKSKRAEDKKKAREKETRKTNISEYIPGMEGSVRPIDDPVDDQDDQQEFYVSV